MGFTKMPALPRQYSESVKQIISSMLTVDASKRPTVNDLLAHPSIKSRISNFMTEEEILKEFNAELPKGNFLKTPAPSSAAPAKPLARPESAKSSRDEKEEKKVIPKNIDSKGLRAAKPYEPSSRARAAPEEVKGLKSSADAPKPISSQDNRGSRDALKQPAPKGVVQTPRFGMGARK